MPKIWLGQAALAGNGRQLIDERHISKEQGCSGAGMRQNAVPANTFEPERPSGKYCLSQPER